MPRPRAGRVVSGAGDLSARVLRSTRLVPTFGFVPRMKLRELARFTPVKTPVEEGHRVLATAPCPHPYFERYVVALDRHFGGLWRVVGIGRDIRMTPSLREVRRIFTHLERQVVRDLGPGKLAMSPEGWSNEPDDLADRRGVLCRFWTFLEGGDAALPLEVEGAVLSAIENPELPGTAFIRLAVTFRYRAPRPASRRRRGRRSSPRSRPRTGSSSR